MNHEVWYTLDEYTNDRITDYSDGTDDFVGLAESVNATIEKAWDLGRDDGFEAGREGGYDDGYDRGFEEGHEQAENDLLQGVTADDLGDLLRLLSDLLHGISVTEATNCLPIRLIEKARAA